MNILLTLVVLSLQHHAPVNRQRLLKLPDACVYRHATSGSINQLWCRPVRIYQDPGIVLRLGKGGGKH
eukprot:scaffold208076_cov38-Prasinocladus_malaysianus.AAC.2